MLDDARFCTACGSALVGAADEPGLSERTHPRPRLATPGIPGTPRLSILDSHGNVTREIVVADSSVVIGRSDAGDSISDDPSVAPQHAAFVRDGESLRLRDLGSPSGSWLFITQPQVLEDNDILLLGSQVMRFRILLGMDDRDSALVRTGSRVPANDVARLEQLLADGSVRDVTHLALGRTLLIGREHGDWVFPYDPTMSSRHAEIRSRPDRSDVVIRDLGSRNGVAVAVRGEHLLRDGQHVLLGKQMLRVDLG